MKVDKTCHGDIIAAYTINLWSMQEIANLLHVSRNAVFKILKSHGVDTSKRTIEVSCTTCGNAIFRNRKRVRLQRNHFCSQDCYTSFLNAGKSGYDEYRNSGRIAHAVVSKYFKLLPGHIVHHKDSNRYNNQIDNLMVFANQGDHIRYHHNQQNTLFGVKNKHTEQIEKEPFAPKCIVSPIWDGSKI